MPQNESSDGSKAPIMRYGQGLSDSTSFEIYAGELENWLTKQKGPVEYLLEVPDIDADDDMWGLSDNPFHPDNQDKTETWKIEKYWTTQAALLDALKQAFARDDKLLRDFQASKLKAKLKKDPFKLKSKDSRLKWLPFGTMAFHALKERYKDSPGNSMLHLCHEYETKLASCDPKNIGLFIRDMESAAGQYLDAIKDLSPEHMIVLQQLAALRGTEDKDCVSFVQHFTAKNENKQYLLQEFLTTLRTYMQNVAAQTLPGKSTGATATANASMRANGTICSYQGCGNRTERPFHKYCKKHFLQFKNQNKNSDQPALPAAALDNMKKKTRAKQRKQFAKNRKGSQNGQQPAVAATAIREPHQVNSVVVSDPAATPSALPVTTATGSTSKKRKASDAPVASSVPASIKKRKLAPQIAKTGLTAVLLKKKTKAVTSAKKVTATAPKSMRRTTKAARAAANAVIAQFGSNESMVTARFANQNPTGLLPQVSYALCGTQKRRKPIA